MLARRSSGGKTLCSDVAYRKDSNEATRDATPQTIIVALVRLEPVPPPDAPPGISRSQCSSLEKIEDSTGAQWRIRGEVYMHQVH